MPRRFSAFFMAIIGLAGISSSAASAQDSDSFRQSLKGIRTLGVVVEDLPPGAKVLGLTAEVIQTDVELKLRQTGLEVVPSGKISQAPGRAYLYVRVNLTDEGKAANIQLEFKQDVLLERNSEHIPSATTWSVGMILSNPTAQAVREETKQFTYSFLNAWLSVNK